MDETSTISSASAQNAKAVSLTDVSLEQNMPNPFAATTSIGYNIPHSFTTARIIITDQNGKVIKQLNVSGGKGVVNVDATTLSSGVYSYSLIVDGKKITTKQMVLNK